MPSPPAFGRRGDLRRGWQSPPPVSPGGRDARGSGSEGAGSGLRRAGLRYISTYRSREGGPFSRGEKVRMRVLVTEIGTRELGERLVGFCRLDVDVCVGAGAYTNLGEPGRVDADNVRRQYASSRRSHDPDVKPDYRIARVDAGDAAIGIGRRGRRSASAPRGCGSSTRRARPGGRTAP